MPKIIVTQGEVRDEYELAASTTIGRGSANAIALADALCSDEHAVIERDAHGRHMLRDLRTPSGTFLRGNNVVEPLELFDGDEIRIGDTRLRFEAAGNTRAGDPAMQALIELLADPADLKRVSAAVMDLTRATCVEIHTLSLDGKTLFPHHRDSRELETSRGSSPNVREDVFAKVMADKQPVLLSDTTRHLDTFTVVNEILSVIVAPLVCEDTVYGVLYAHRKPPMTRDGEDRASPPFSAMDLALCAGIARLAAMSLHASAQLDRRTDLVVRSSLLENLVPLKLVMMARTGKLDPRQSHHFAEVHVLYSAPLDTPESEAMRAASNAALALPPIERVALGGRLLESAVDSDLSSVSKVEATPVMTADEILAEIEKLKRGL